MKIDIITLFPKMFIGPFEESIIKRAQDNKLVSINTHDLRKWAKDKHNTVDDRPFGGGKGMVLMV
jgi:tRNA (guanine37-N1)-methyltransferase